MQKFFLQSKTVWGGILLAAWQFLTQLQIELPWLQAATAGLGAFLTAWGIRDAIPEKSP